jgi:hypothetical protein
VMPVGADADDTSTSTDTSSAKPKRSSVLAELSPAASAGSVSLLRAHPWGLIHRAGPVTVFPAAREATPMLGGPIVGDGHEGGFAGPWNVGAHAFEPNARDGHVRQLSGVTVTGVASRGSLRRL